MRGHATQVADVSGWWTITKLYGVPVRIHWSALLGAIFFSGLSFAPGAWLGFLLVILAHELGHAFVVLRTGQRLLGVSIHGFGGECQWAGDATPLQRSLIAWGGVAAQAALFLVALPLSWLVGARLGLFGLDLFHALTVSSAFIAALNLLPLRPFDGAEAWKLPGLLRERRALRAAREAGRPPQIRILGEAPPRGFRWPMSEPARQPAQPRVEVRQAAAQSPPIRPVAQPSELESYFRKLARDAREARGRS